MLDQSCSRSHCASSQCNVTSLCSSGASCANHCAAWVWPFALNAIANVWRILSLAQGSAEYAQVAVATPVTHDRAHAKSSVQTHTRQSVLHAADNHRADI